MNYREFKQKQEAEANAFTDGKIPVILAVEIQIRIAAFACIRDAEHPPEREPRRRFDIGVILIICEQTPFLCFRHAEQRRFFVEFDVERLLRALDPGGVPTSLDGF